jgi:hypothetical protein
MGFKSMFLMLQASARECHGYHTDDVISNAMLVMSAFPFVAQGVSLFLSFWYQYLFYTFLFMGLFWTMIFTWALDHVADFSMLPVARCSLEHSGAHIDDNTADAVFVALFCIIVRYRCPVPDVHASHPRSQFNNVLYYVTFSIYPIATIASSLYLERWTVTDIVISVLFSCINAPLFCFILVDIIHHQLQHPYVKKFCDFMSISNERIGHDWPDTTFKDSRTNNRLHHTFNSSTSDTSRSTSS